MITFRRLKFENRNWAECEPDLQLANSSVCHPENVPSKNPFSLSNSIGIRFLARLVMTIKNAGLRTTLAPIRSRRIHGLFASSFLSSLRTALAPILSRCLCVAVLSFFAFPSSSPAQTIDKPAQIIDEDITAFTFAPDGRIVYSVRRMFKNKKYDMQRDDIWIQDTGGRRHRIFQGEHFTVTNPIAPGETDRNSDRSADSDEKGKKHKRDKDKPTTPP